MRVWVTRTAADAEGTATRLRALGHAPLVAPVLEVRDLPGAIDVAGAGALAFTSRTGVFTFAGRSPERALPVFAVGEATAEAARVHGFSDVRAACADSAALAWLIAANHDPARGHVLHPAARDPAHDLAGDLEARGVAARHHPLYETVSLALPDSVAAALAASPPELDAVLVHSPRAAEVLARLIAQEPATQALAAFCISEAAAEPLKELNFRHLHAARFPNEASLLNLLSS